jgi:hypothetical protein
MFEVLIEPSEQKMGLVERYEDAWRTSARGGFAEAASIFDELKECDHPSRVLADRCRELIVDHPEKWDGAYQMREK